MQPSWCCRGSRGKVEGEVESRAFLRVAEVRPGKVVGQVSTVGLLPSTKEGEDAAPFLTGSTAGSVWNGHLREAGALEAWLGFELKALTSTSGALGSTCG